MLSRDGVDKLWMKSKDIYEFAKLVEAAAPEQKPLTDEQVDMIIASNVTITDKYLLEAVYMAIREVEAAHGIGGEE